MKPQEINNNQKLYEFLATSYDIKNLAKRINDEDTVSINLFNLKKIVSDSNIA